MLNNLTNKRQMDASYGVSLDKKGDNTMPVTFLNIGGLPFHNSFPKSKEVRMLVGNNNMDILGLAEVNINWENI